jgi:aminopeptidase S
VVLGAHLDSSLDGPGLNDDGSGVAAILAVAQVFHEALPGTTLRFAFWAAEETGLHGSTGYVDALSQVERARIVGYLNADMLGSPNGFAGVYDEPAAPEGSALIRDSLAAALDAAGVAWESVDTGLGADHAPFAAAGIPTGGVFAGASEPLTATQAERSDGRAGFPADACYHLACDDRANVNEALLLELTKTLAWAAADLSTSR